MPKLGKKFSGDIGGTSDITKALKTTGSPVDVGAAAPPSTGQVLTATSATTAEWQDPGAAVNDIFVDPVLWMMSGE